MDFEWANIPRKLTVGDRIKLVSMPDDPNPIPDGEMGTITKIQDRVGVIDVDWDNKNYSLNLAFDKVPGDVDTFEIIGEGTVDKSINKSMPKPTLTGNKKTDLGKKYVKSMNKGLNKGKVKDIKVEQDEVPGGLADTLSPDDLAKKHGVSKEDIQKEIELGIEIELEHTGDPLVAKEITMDHITEFPDYYSNERYGLVASEKGLEKELDEITSAGGGGGLAGASGYSYSGPLGKKKNESRIINVKELVSEVTTTYNSGDYDDVSETPFDVNKDGWFWNDKPWYEDGKIVDDIAQLDHNWKDELLSITKEDLIKSVNLVENKIDLKDFIKDFKSKLKKNKDKLKDLSVRLHKNIDVAIKDIESGNIKKDEKAKKNLNNVVKDIIKIMGQVSWMMLPGGTTSLIVLRKVFPKLSKILRLSIEDEHQKPEEDLDETTTFGSVFGGDFPVTPTFAAKKGEHGPSKKPIWKGGQIVQKIKNSGVLTEINKVKYHKGGDYVKFDPKCVKYKNQPWCSQGAVDNPIKLSKTTSDNITEVAKKLGVSEKEVEKMVINKLSR